MQAVDLEIEADLEIIRDAAAEAAGIAMRFFRHDPEVWLKAGSSPVSEADMAVDAFLKKALLGPRPDYGWLSEETADERAAEPRARTFVVDPIDGTRAFIEGKNTWCVSIGVVENGRPVAGVLHCPALGEVITAREGAGARQDGRSLAVREPVGPLRVAGPGQFVSRLPTSHGVPVVGHSYVPSLAYRVAMVARGDIDGTFVKPNSHDWDLAAADLILAEAGGRIVRADGASLRYATGNPSHGALAAASGPLLSSMLDVIVGDA